SFWEALEAVRIGMRQGTEAGLAFERAAAGRLALTPACRNLVGLFLQKERAKKLPEGLGGGAEVRRGGVVGAGVMGAGIAQLAPLRAGEVAVQKITRAAPAPGRDRIQKLFARGVEPRVLPADEARRRAGAVRGTVDWEGFGDVDLVIE